MAFVSERTTATNPAEVLASNDRAPSDTEARTTRHVLRNATGTASIFLGGQGVTDVDGFEWQASDGPFEVELEPGEQVWGFAAINQDVHTLDGGR